MKDKKDRRNVIVKASAIGIIIILTMSGGAFLLNMNNDDKVLVKNERITQTTLGERLNDKGWMVYGASNCAGCIQQEAILGHEKDGLQIHDCVKSKENYQLCDKQGITAYPTWHNVFSNESLIGVQTFGELEEMAK